MSNVVCAIGFHRNKISEKSSEGSVKFLEQAAALAAKLCAEPRPAGDSVKAAIGRAAKRAHLSYTRTKDIWYGDARRIEPWEMEHLFSGADEAEIDFAMGGVEVARQRLMDLNSPLSRKAVAALDAALRLLGDVANPAHRQAR